MKNPNIPVLTSKKHREQKSCHSFTQGSLFQQYWTDTQDLVLPDLLCSLYWGEQGSSRAKLGKKISHQPQIWVIFLPSTQASGLQCRSRVSKLLNHCFLCFGWISVTLMEVLQLWHSGYKEHLVVGKSWVVSFWIWECKHTMSNSELSPSSRQRLSKVSVQFLTRPSSVSRQLLKSSSCKRLNWGEYWKFMLINI